jgi:hypothetical protein|tara:strand:- start:3007 stop:3594 length:588 start_codon:yes stop_codon:yes gene_type:complete
MPRVSFLHEHKGKKVLSVQMDLLKEKPVIYYTPIETIGHFLSYGFNGGKEQLDLVNSTVDSSKLYSPVIKIKSLPTSLRPDESISQEKYNPIELEDVSSLAKLSYGFEEASFPLFAFPYKEKWFLGVFLNFNEDGPSYFCHVTLNNEIEKPFLKYATTKDSDPQFVDHTGEHGYSYIKIIKLKEAHPMVDYGQIQ